MIDNKTQVLLPRVLFPLVSLPRSVSTLPLLLFLLLFHSLLPLVPLLLFRRFSASTLLFQSNRFRLIAL